jgi:hypothetical protein
MRRVLNYHDCTLSRSSLGKMLLSVKIKYIVPGFRFLGLGVTGIYFMDSTHTWPAFPQQDAPNDNVASISKRRQSKATAHWHPNVLSVTPASRHVAAPSITCERPLRQCRDVTNQHGHTLTVEQKAAALPWIHTLSCGFLLIYLSFCV